MKYSMICCVLYGLFFVVSASKEGGNDTCSWCKETLECEKSGFRCSNGEKCIRRELYCDDKDDCGDNSDEMHCRSRSCAEGLIECSYYTYYSSSSPFPMKKCIPSTWRCDGSGDCPNGNDEENCDNYERPRTQWTAAEKVTRWVTEQRNEFGDAAQRWGSSVDRLALTLYYAANEFGSSKPNETEMANELTIRLLSSLLSEKLSGIPSTELASYVHAFLALCINPRNFYGYDIVEKMRSRADQENYTNPYVFLALCNAGEIITESDRKKLTDTFENKHRKFWAGTQALVVMALACANKQRGNDVDIVEFLEMVPKLKKQLHRNCTGIDLPTKALILQAMISTYSADGSDNSDQVRTFRELLRTQKPDGSFGDGMDTFYVAPILSCKSLANVNSNHCKKSAEISASYDLYPEDGPTTRVQYSLWIGDKKKLERNLALRVPQNTSVYGVMERAAELDSRFRFNYSMKSKKPYINAMSGKRDNPLTGKFWFLYNIRNGKATLSKESPADIIPSDNDHYVMWYRRGTWID